MEYIFDKAIEESNFKPFDYFSVAKPSQAFGLKLVSYLLLAHFRLSPDEVFLNFQLLQFESQNDYHKIDDRIAESQVRMSDWKDLAQIAGTDIYAEGFTAFLIDGLLKCAGSKLRKI